MKRLPARSISFEIGLAALVLASGLYALGFLYLNGYLPQPFFVDPYDTFMDWFNTSYWARQPGTYDIWRSIYPPLSFVFLRIFGRDWCYIGDSISGRDCDWAGFASLFGFYLLDVVLIAKSFLKIDRQTALPRTIALSFGYPMLFGLERGNLVIPCLSVFIIAYGPLCRSARLRWLAAGLAANFKPYLIVAFVPALLRRKWLWFEGALLATIAVFIITWGLNGEGDPATLVENIRNFAEMPSVSGWTDTYSAGSYGPMIQLLTGEFPLMKIVGSWRLEAGEALFRSMVLAGQVSIILASIAAWYRPMVVPAHRFTLFAVMFALMTSEAGFYANIFFLFLVFMERWEGRGRVIALVMAYALCVPVDWQVAPLHPPPKESFLGGHTVVLDYGVTLGPFIRPGLMIACAVAISAATIAAVFRRIASERAEGREMVPA